MTPRPRPRSRSRSVSVGHTATTRPRLMLAPVRVWEKRGQECKGIKNVGGKSGTGRHLWARQQSPARATRQDGLRSTQINICLGAHATGMGDASADAHPAPRGSRRNKLSHSLICRAQSVARSVCGTHAPARTASCFHATHGLAHTRCTRVATQISHALPHACAQKHTSTHLRTILAGRRHAHRHAQGVNTC